MTPEPAQRAYARIVARAAALGLAGLLLAFLGYVTGVIDARIPVETMAAWWSMPSAALRARGGPWMELPVPGETLVLLGVAWLATCSILGLAAAARSFLAAGDRLAAGLAMVQAVVLAGAAGIPLFVRF